MSQFLQPTSDISVGIWSPTPLISQVGELTRSDVDYISSTDNGTGTCDIALATGDFPVAGAKTLRYAYSKSAAAGNSRDLTVRLKQGGVVLQTFTHVDISESWVQADQTVTASITNYSLLSVEFDALGTTGGNPDGRRSVRVSWALLEIPNAIIPTVVQSSFTANAIVMIRPSGSFTMNATINAVAGPVWSQPGPDELIVDSTPAFEFTIPAIGVNPVHFELQLDKLPVFNTGSYRLYDSSVDQTGWEYFNGTSWVSVSPTGVAATYTGNLARFTVPVSLPQGIWYRRIRAK